MPLKMRGMKEYLAEVLGEPLTLRPAAVANRLPPFLGEMYDVAEIDLFEKECLLLIDRGKKGLTPMEIEKHRNLVVSKGGPLVIYVAQTLTAYQRKRLIERRVPFIVPRSQMFLPILGIDLRERYQRALPPATHWSPVTQAAVLFWIYHGFSGADTPSSLGGHLGYAKMSMTRAFNELEVSLQEIDGFRIESIGRERQVLCHLPSRELWEKSKPFLRNPVQRRGVMRRVALDRGEWSPLAGLSAVASLSMLNEPNGVTVAMTAREAKKRGGILPPSFIIEGGMVNVEIWRYSPTLNGNRFGSSKKIADPLSIYLSMRDDAAKDERVAAALDDILKEVPWQ